MKNKDLNSLIKRIKNKDPNVFEEMDNELWVIVYYIAYSYVSNQELVKDITQQTFIIIHQKIDKLQANIAFYSWMNRLVINLCPINNASYQKPIL